MFSVNNQLISLSYIYVSTPKAVEHTWLAVVTYERGYRKSCVFCRIVFHVHTSDFWRGLR